MIQSFASMGITTVLWWLVGYSLCFSGGADGIYGNFDLAFLRGVTPSSMYAPSGIPLVVLIAYQMTFAIITPALITGAFTNRVTFKAYLIFLVVWQLFGYYPFVHVIWGGGVLAEWGVRDFAGGIVVHASAGWAALASVLYVGRRKFVDTPPTQHPFHRTGCSWSGGTGESRTSSPADRSGCRIGDDHAGGRVRADLRLGGDRHRCRPGLLPRGAAEKPSPLG
jgi:ammonium transporter, Amt family